MNTLLSLWDIAYGDQLRGLAESGLMWVTAAGLAAIPLAVVVGLVNLLGRRWLSAGQMALLWCLVFVRLLFPVAPASPFSLHNLLPQDSPPAASSGNPRTAAVLASEPMPDEQPVAGPLLAHPTRMPIPSRDWLDFFTEIAELVWFVAAAGIVCWTLVVHWRFRRRVRRTTVCHDERLTRLWNTCCAQIGIRSSPAIVVFDGVDQPAVMGLVQVELLLPSHALNLSDEQLQMIMLHELAHVRRWDLALNWGLVVLRALHWWNPVFWLASGRYQSLREQACDAFVMRTLDGATNRDYGDLLLNLAERAPATLGWRVLMPASLLGFFQSFFRKRALRLRLLALRSTPRYRSRWHTAAVGLLIVAAALCGLTDASSSAVQTDRTSNSEPWIIAGIDWRILRLNGAASDQDASLDTRTYAVDEILREAHRDQMSSEECRLEIEISVQQILDQSKPQHGPARRLAAAAETRSHDAPKYAPEESREANQPAPIDELAARPDLRWHGDSLLVRATPAQHEAIAALLRVWKASGLAQMSIECRLITSSRELATAAGVEWRSFGAESAVGKAPLSVAARRAGPVVQASARIEDHVPVFVTPLNDREMKVIVEAAQSDTRSNLMFAPKITLFNGQQAQVADCRQRPFVVGFDSEQGQAPRPRVEVIEEGTKFTLRTVLQDDRHHIQLTGQIELCSIFDVTVVSAATATGNLSIQAPRVRRCQIAVAAEVEDGQPLLIGCLPTPDHKEFFYVLLTVRRIIVDTQH